MRETTRVGKLGGSRGCVLAGHYNGPRLECLFVKVQEEKTGASGEVDYPTVERAECMHARALRCQHLLQTTAPGQLVRASPAIEHRLSRNQLSPSCPYPIPTLAHAAHDAVAPRCTIAKLRGALRPSRELSGDRGRPARRFPCPGLVPQPCSQLSRAQVRNPMTHGECRQRDAAYRASVN